LASMPRMEPTYIAILRAAVAARAVILYPIAALTRQMTVTTYPAPIADLRDVRLVGVFFYCVRRVIAPPRADQCRSRSGLSQSRYVCGLQEVHCARRGRAGSVTQWVSSATKNG
jgi:hypothetical protein